MQTGLRKSALYVRIEQGSCLTRIKQSFAQEGIMNMKKAYVFVIRYISKGKDTFCFTY